MFQQDRSHWNEDGQGQRTTGFVRRWLEDDKMKRGLLSVALIALALLAFELFNFSLTQAALADLLGELRFAGLPWAAGLAAALCGMDVAGIVWLLTPEEGGLAALRHSGRLSGIGVEGWYLLGAWFLASALNAALAWWGLSVTLLADPALGNEIFAREQLLAAVPALMVVLFWPLRILLVGAFAVAGNRALPGFTRMAPNAAQADARRTGEAIRRAPGVPADPSPVHVPAPDTAVRRAAPSPYTPGGPAPVRPAGNLPGNPTTARPVARPLPRQPVYVPDEPQPDGDFADLEPVYVRGTNGNGNGNAAKG